MSSLSSCFFVPVSVFFDNCVFPQIGRKSVEYLHVCQDHTEKKKKCVGGFYDDCQRGSINS